MTMFSKIGGLGEPYGLVKKQFRNRTGAQMLKGQVAMLDFLDTQSEVTAVSTTAGGPGDPAGVYANLTPCTQAAVDAGQPVVVCADTTVDDDAIGWFVCWGFCEVAVCDDDVSTTDIDKGDTIAILVSESAVYVQALANGNRSLGIAHEDAAADSNDTDRKIDASAHRRLCFWTGGLPCYGNNKDA